MEYLKEYLIGYIQQYLIECSVEYLIAHLSSKAAVRSKSIRLFVSVCLCVCLSLFLSLCLCLFLSLSACLSVVSFWSVAFTSGSIHRHRPNHERSHRPTDIIYTI